MLFSQLPNLAVPCGVEKIMTAPCESNPGDGLRNVILAFNETRSDQSGVLHQLVAVKNLSIGILLKLGRSHVRLMLNQQQSNKLHVAFHSEALRGRSRTHAPIHDNPKPATPTLLLFP